MRLKLLIALLLIAGGCVPASATIAHVACSGTCSNTGATSATLPPSGSLTFTGGNFLWVAVRTATGVTVNTPTDTKGNTFACNPSVDVAASVRVTSCYAQNIASGTDTITVTVGTSTNLHVAVDQYSGVPTGCNPVSSQISGTATAATSVTSGTISPSVTSSLLVSVALSVNGSPTAGTNMIMRTSTTRLGLEDRLNVTAGSYTVSANWTGSGDGVIVVSSIASSCSNPTKPPVVI